MLALKPPCHARTTVPHWTSRQLGTRKRIRELRLAGTTMQGVAAILNEEGTTTVTGRPWSWQNVQRVCNSLQLDDQTDLAAGRADDVPHRPTRRLHVPGSSSI